MKAEPAAIKRAVESLNVVVTNVIVDHDVVAVEVAASLQHSGGVNRNMARGVAKRNPMDKPDAALGAELALSRALAKLSRIYERSATRRIHDNDVIREARLARRTRPARKTDTPTAPVKKKAVAATKTTKAVAGPAKAVTAKKVGK